MSSISFVFFAYEFDYIGRPDEEFSKRSSISIYRHNPNPNPKIECRIHHMFHLNTHTFIQDEHDENTSVK